MFNYLEYKSTPLLLVGPDQECEQWIGDIARHSGHPYVVGQKKRLGDRQVRVTLPDLSAYRERTAVIIDDIIASGQPLLQCIDARHARGIEHIGCAAIHGLIADNIDKQLRARGVDKLITSNSIPHPSNRQ